MLATNEILTILEYYNIAGKIPGIEWGQENLYRNLSFTSPVSIILTT